MDAAGYHTQHRETLEQALAAIRKRDYFSAYPESPSPRIYGENAATDGQAAFDASRGTAFAVDTPGADGTVATETSPFGFDLEIAYPRIRPDGVDALLTAASTGMTDWRDVGPDGRAGVCLEILARLHKRVFELANAVQHTSGQAFVMAFQAGGAHALDRALESVAYAYDEMTRHPATATWEKPARGEPLRMEKTFTVVPRGVALVIGCNTFPTWNSYPGLFASLVCGNPVVVKPHPRAVLPLAITVQVCREVLAEAGLDPNLVTLAAEDPADHLAKVLAVRPEVRLIDYTGSTAFGEWLEANARQAVVFTEKAGVNSVVVDSTDSFKGMCGNLAFSFALYTGQMCTTPQNVYVPAGGIDTDEGPKTYDEVAAGIGAALGKLLGDDARAVEWSGAGRVAGRGPSGVRRRDRADAAVAGPRRGRRGRLRDGMLRPRVVPHRHAIVGRRDRDLPAYDPRARRDDGGGLLHRRWRHRRDAIGRARRRSRVVGEPHRPGVREPVGGVLRLPRHRRQPGRERLVHRRRLRRVPIPRDPVPSPHLTALRRWVRGT
jgi:phenylacetic acid degradation protein paaN